MSCWLVHTFQRSKQKLSKAFHVDANKKIADDMSAKLGSLSGGMSLPPGMKLPF